MEPLSLYIHIPFCTTRCHYCDFNTYAGLGRLIPSYLEALKKEITLWGLALSKTPVGTIFFGGGTPSLLAGDQIASILSTCREIFSVAPDAEISLEANPGTVTPASLRALQEAGVNRLSLGAQSFLNEELRWLGRTHTAQEVEDAYLWAREAGFLNINLDLIYGLPEQTLDAWGKSLRKAVALAPKHLSLYSLTIEDETPLGKAAAMGKVPQPDPDLAADMYLLAEETLAGEGYEHYEISNWARPGYRCRHNITYWENRPYLGFGAGAHSYWGGFRFANVRYPSQYIRQVNQLAKGSPHIPKLCKEPAEEALRPSFMKDQDNTIRSRSPVDFIEFAGGGQKREIADTIILGLRLKEGIAFGEFARRFGEDLSTLFGMDIEELACLGLLEEPGPNLRLTQKGRLLANEVFVRFLG